MQNKLVIFVFLPLSLLLISIGTMNFQQSYVKAQSQSNSTQTFTDRNQAFNLNYPLDWEIAPRNSTFPYYGETTALALRPTTDEPVTPLNEMFVSVSVSDVKRLLEDNQSTPAEFLDKLVADKISSFEDPSSAYGNLNVTLLGNNYTKLGDQPAKELTFLAQNIGTFEVDTFAIHDDQLYHVNFMGPQSKVSEVYKEFQQIKDSFRFVP
ncbi:MAG TPA: PsbP-related protein [Candidatus Nitrosocosmicus sp.]|jgi:PsbP-like protein|nr:PsbP-related protein [Candidatus Nitrosocosmicus sp.]